MSASEKRRAVVLFDGECPFCRKSVSILKRLDWLKRFEFRNMRRRENWPTTKEPLSMERMIEEMHLITTDGSVYAGFDAFRWIFSQMPITMGLVPFMFVPGVSQMGNRMYRWVATRRFQLLPCHEGVCVLPSKR